MKEQLYIIKIGGHVIDDSEALDQLLTAFSKLQGAKILVHGGGKMATQVAGQLSTPQQIIDGRRITDEATLKIVTMVYAGYINKNIVAQLQAKHCNALGLTGADGNLIQAHKRSGAAQDYGFAGDIDRVNAPLLRTLLQAGISPVIAPITHDMQAQLLNTNADTIAQELAQAMGSSYAVQLIYCFEQAGVLLDIADTSSVIAAIDKEKFRALKYEGIIHSGMLPKLSNAFAALDKGVHAVIIGKWSQLNEMIEGHAGTKIEHGL